MLPPCALVGLCSFTALAFEITLIRIFSVRFNYHYAALVISISMIGLVAGGLFTYLNGLMRDPRKGVGGASRVAQSSAVPGETAHTLAGPAKKEGSAANLALPAAWALAVSYPGTLIVSFLTPFDHARLLWEGRQIIYLFVEAASFALPFFCYGVVISSLMGAFAASVNRIYAADLIGAACGVAAVLVAADHLKSEYIVAGLALIPPLYLCFRPGRRVARILCAALVATLSAALFSGIVSLPISPYKGLMQVLKDDGARLLETINSAHSRLDLFENPRMRFAPGLSLAYEGPVPRGLGVAIDGDVAGVIVRDESPADSALYDRLPQAVPLKALRPERVLMVGFTSSLGLLMSYRFGAESVIVAERDRSVARLITRYYGPESLHGRSLRRATGRGFLTKGTLRPDLIVLSRLGYFPAGAFGLREDYDLTTDALAFYLQSLTERGALFIETFLLPPPRQELRLMTVILEAIRSTGVTDPSRHLLVFRTWDTIAFVVKKRPFAAAEQEQMRALLRENQFDLLYPAVAAGHEPFIAGIDYAALLTGLASPGSAQDFIAAYPFDVSAVTDDRPFFHYFLKLRSVPAVYAMTGRKWPYFIQEGMAIPFVAVLLVLFVAALFGGLALFRRLPRKDPREGRARGTVPAVLSAYFLAIAVAFMFLEVFFIHTLLLPLGAPMTAFAATVGVLLVSAGSGSLLASRLSHGSAVLITGVLPLLALACLALKGNPSPWPAVTMIALLGLPMGFFLPAGVRLLEERGCAGLVPYVYAVNGAGSIVAPAVASMLAAAAGFASLVIFAAILYGLSLLLLHLARHRYKDNAA